MNSKQIMMLFFCVIGAALVVIGLYFLRRFLRYRVFPSVEGTIVSNDIIAFHEQDTPSLLYMPKVVFKYAVQGQEFIGEKWHSFAGMKPPRYTSRQKAESVVSQYVTDGKARVFYDPDKHDSAFIYNGPAIHFYGFFIIGAGFLAFGAAYLFAS